MFEKLITITALCVCVTVPTHDSPVHCKDRCKKVYELCKKDCKTPACIRKCASDWITCKKGCDK